MEPRRVLPDALASPEGLGVTFSGVTVCVLTLMSIQPSSVGDTLLLTRLERGSAPITIHIPTALTKVREGLEAWSSRDEPGAGLTAPFLPQAPLSSVLSDFDTIQKEQKETISCTDKHDWWLHRFELDRRMKVGERHPVLPTPWGECSDPPVTLSSLAEPHRHPGDGGVGLLEGSAAPCQPGARAGQGSRPSLRPAPSLRLAGLGPGAAQGAELPGLGQGTGGALPWLTPAPCRRSCSTLLPSSPPLTCKP